ncbi:hypothetical protein FACS1894155_03550 [Bacteroidia bacterium]|nr:hypothetical protein FACS1894155_03550 [Bacteroidia bacterium]
MKKEKVLILWTVLALFSIVFVSCLNDDDSNKNIIGFIYEPIIISENNKDIVMKTQYGEILAPKLNKANPGEYYLTNFLMDTTIHPYTAYNLEYKRMGADTLRLLSAPKIENTEYNSQISNIEIYIKDKHADNLLKLKNDSAPVEFICMDSTFFVRPVFEGQARETAHELKFFINLLPVVGPGPHVDPVTLYIAAKATDKEISRNAYALNISTAFKRDSQSSDNGVVEFNLKFKTGVDSEGIDIYKDYRGNPVRLKIK